MPILGHNVGKHAIACVEILVHGVGCICCCWGMIGLGVVINIMSNAGSVVV